MNRIITGKIQYIEAPNNGYAPYANSLFIDDDIKALLDTNCGPANINFFLKQSVDVIINSHFHQDHVRNNYKFTRAEIWAHTKDAPAIRSLEVFHDYYGISQYNEEETEIWEKYREDIDIQPSGVHREFTDREILDFGSTQIQVIHTPGHSPGHCCFLLGNSILFSTDFGLNAFGPWYGHPCSDVTDLINSIKLCIEINPSILIPSHRAIITEDIPQKLQNYLNVIHNHEEKLLNSLKKPSTLDELRDLFICYGPSWSKYPPRKAYEKFFILAHLKRLLSLGEIKESDNQYYIN